MLTTLLPVEVLLFESLEIHSFYGCLCQDVAQIVNEGDNVLIATARRTLIPPFYSRSTQFKPDTEQFKPRKIF